MDIEWSLKALKQAKAIPKLQREKIVNAVESLSGWPACTNVKALKNHQYPYRLRVGNYRVFFSIDKNITIVTVEEVKKRDERTY